MPTFFELQRCGHDNGRADDRGLRALSDDFVGVGSGNLVAKANALLAMWPVTICRRNAATVRIVNTLKKLEGEP